MIRRIKRNWVHNHIKVLSHLPLAFYLHIFANLYLLRPCLAGLSIKQSWKQKLSDIVISNECVSKHIGNYQDLDNKIFC